ncbi:2-oxoglutarate dehydrogenase E1 component, putative [Trypanosoma equiperdum]|uniref:2-oxoglutarate dehydrogenase E1 component, putative n=1 Tax=Trypanosoma equiperdum TaxID=5694 RepID=A0A1G4IGL9_TRYEQ|nr:2-oxoglutarate dehydrogenase E1 component, putative [Trypanosoma equiperdum]
MMRRAFTRGACAAQSFSMVRFYTDAKTVRQPHRYDQAITAENEVYIEQLLKQYEQNPCEVDGSWIPILEKLRSGSPDAPLVQDFTRPVKDASKSDSERRQSMGITWMVTAYERYGHHYAKVNPLRSEQDVESDRRDLLNLHYSNFGFTDQDLTKVFPVDIGGGLKEAFGENVKEATLQQIVEKLQMMYCGSIGFEFLLTEGDDVRHWFHKEILKTFEPLSKEERIHILDDVVKSCGFETFIQLKYGTQLRFGLDGAEALVPAVIALMQEASDLGVTSFVQGMPHRGRLNLLANVKVKPLTDILAEFEGKTHRNAIARLGDNKYHLGADRQIELRNGKVINFDLLCNPSHLEAMNPLVLGKARARMVVEKDSECVRTLPIIAHGDAAISGLGMGHETMGLWDLDNYRVGGTVHIITNNQVGFTTDSVDARRAKYCSDISKIHATPVLHVNSNDVEACVRAARIAARFRQTFHRDIIIDLIGYRRNGHNEADFPDFTQPQMYQIVRSLRPLVDLYSDTLVEEGVLTKEDVKAKKKEYESRLREAYETAQSCPEYTKVIPNLREDAGNASEGYDLAAEKEANLPKAVETGVDIEVLRRVGLHVTTIPSEVKKVHPVVERTYAARKKAIESGEGAEWCLAEMLAFGATALEGTHVRLAGEDVERGTFTQRHAAVTDLETNKKYIPLCSLSEDQALVTICNSSLSEFGVSGFELGYNAVNPHTLGMWEAQFGDFANGAQVIFDQFLCCGEEKWNAKYSLVLSLPHGYSGAGPEHSSARIERYLQLCSDTDVVPHNFRRGCPLQLLEARIQRFNWQVCYPSTPANYFHVLRRQVRRGDPKPLVVFFSKARLRAPNVSSLSEMSTGTSFKPVIDTAVNDEVIARKVLFCTGQIESIVDDRRKKLQAEKPGVHDDVVLVKLEQLSPFPWEQVADVLEKYHSRNPNVQFAWLQEEPKNMGSWAYVRPRLQRLLRHLGMAGSSDFLPYVGRVTAASPSTGYATVHAEEEAEIIRQALA